MSLKIYHQKRNFSHTHEPYGAKKDKTSLKCIYVIQKHAASHLHYDFRLELQGVLKSWAVPKGPSLDPKIKHLAVHVEDHPLEYAEFEGIIPPDEYGGGTVMIWDKGFWEPLDENIDAAYHKGNITFNLHGKKLQGRWKLVRIKNRSISKNAKEQWLLFKVNDEYSRSEAQYNITKSEPYSAQTDRSLKQIEEDSDRVWTKEGESNNDPLKKKKRRSSFIKISQVKGIERADIPKEIFPALANLVNQPPDSDTWLHEIKWDGYRLLAKINKGRVSLLTRRNLDWTYQFPTLLKALEQLKFKDLIFDGEIVALDKDNKANFQILQNSVAEPSLQHSLIYYIFDLLFYAGYSLLNVPLIERKKILQKLLLSKNQLPEIKYNDHIVGMGKKVFENACKYGLEGIVSKRVNSHYRQRRTKDWLKIKCVHRQEFVIGGYTDPKSSRQFFGALLLGYYNEEKNLIYCGRVGTGFTQDSLKEVASILKKIEEQRCPFFNFPEKDTRHIHWLKPEKVTEVEYLAITQEGVLRHPSFKGLREDKKAEEVTFEQPFNKKIKEGPNRAATHVIFTNLERILYPQQNLNKRDLLNYFESVADWILPHIKNRPLTLVRCLQGSGHNCFYQKRMNKTVPSTVKAIDVMEHNKPEPYIYINNIDGLLGLVQMGVLEIHPWGSSIKDIEKPDRIIFDLDPAPDVAWEEVIATAHLLNQFINYLGLKNFVKTTGGKGLHIVIPIRPTLEWDEARNITKRIAELFVIANPTKYIATMSKAKRAGKIFIDYLRNTRGATAIAAYSTRAKANATIAVPLAWEELTPKIKSDSFDVTNINERLKSLKKDPWEGFFKTRQSISDRIKKIL